MVTNVTVPNPFPGQPPGGAITFPNGNGGTASPIPGNSSQVQQNPGILSFGFPPVGFDPVFFNLPIGSSFMLQPLLGFSSGQSLPIRTGATPTTFGFPSALLGGSFTGSGQNFLFGNPQISFPSFPNNIAPASLFTTPATTTPAAAAPGAAVAPGGIAAATPVAAGAGAPGTAAANNAALSALANASPATLAALAAATRNATPGALPVAGQNQLSFNNGQFAQAGNQFGANQFGVNMGVPMQFMQAVPQPGFLTQSPFFGASPQQTSLFNPNQFAFNPGVNSQFMQMQPQFAFSGMPGQFSSFGF